jgi:TetR/AcrR family transcriptional repressor of nem operon
LQNKLVTAFEKGKAMNTKVANKQDTRTALLEVGTNIMLEKGYSNTGIQEILNTLQVPKGSFYHYFDSKENFAIEVIRHFDQSYSADLIRTLQNTKMTPLQRLRDYCETSKNNLSAQECRRGCLIGNLSQEMSDQSEVLRTELLRVMQKWKDLFANCIAEGQKAGEIKKDQKASALAELFSAGWSGAVMRAKTVKNTEPLEVFIDLMFNSILKA